jgi:hypothetical protein
MERAGMVHALHKIHRLLKPDGILVDIHPPPEPSAIAVRVGAQTISAGWLNDTDDYGDYEAADQALARVTRDGLFTVEREGAFEFVTRADTLAELRAYVAEEWENARVDDLTAARIDDLMRAPTRNKEILLREAARIARLRPRLPV